MAPTKKKGAGKSGKKSSNSSQSSSHPFDPRKFIENAYPILKKEFGKVQCALNYKKPHELAVAVILSAQCTDERVNIVTPPLFERFPEAKDFAEAPTEELEKLIFTTGFYHNKAKNIKGFCQAYVNEHHGRMPRDLETLVKMPGVGRKTGNVILQELFEIPSGVVVDTHVTRLSQLMKLTVHKDAVKIERDLMALLPREYWIDWTLFMIRLGRSCCPARRPNCEACPIRLLCPSSSAI